MDLARRQAGIVSRRQLLQEGVSPARIRTEVEGRRWQVLARGVYATFTGPLPPDSRLWVALLRAGPGAVAGPRTSLWLFGLDDRPPESFDVFVPGRRRVRGAAGVERRQHLSALAHPALSPPRLRLEDALLERTARVARDADAVDPLIRAIARRLTTADRVARRLDRWARHPRRRLVLEVLSATERGVRSMLELRWHYDVERPHRLPPAVLNRADQEGAARRYRDAEFEPWGLVVELDGQEAHPDEERFRDRRRDNRVTVSGRRTLRYGWHEVTADPCGVAAEVATVLQALGWPGTPIGCGPRCPLS